jgi:hypothetical protein
MKQSRRNIASCVVSLAVLILGVSPLTVAQASGPAKNPTPAQTSSPAAATKSGKATAPKPDSAKTGTASPGDRCQARVGPGRRFPVPDNTRTHDRPLRLGPASRPGAAGERADDGAFRQ